MQLFTFDFTNISYLIKRFSPYFLIMFSFITLLFLSGCDSCNTTPTPVNIKRVKIVGNIDSSGSSVGTGLLAVNRYSSYFGVATGVNGKIATTTNSGINWIAQNSGGITDSLLSVAAIDSDTIIAVGRAGLIIRSTNKGITWNTVFLDLTKKLKFVSFGGKKYGIAVGDNGVVLRSNNSGLNWISDTLNNGTNNLPWLNINCGSMNIDSSAWICCDSGKIFYTFNFGVSWSQQVSGVNVKLNGISFCDNQRGTCVGANSTMLETYNGGTNWIFDTVPNPAKELLSVSRTDKYIAFVSGTGYLFREQGYNKTVIFNNPYYKCTAINVNTPYMVAFAVNSNDTMIYQISCDECPCTRCSHQLTIIPLPDPDGCTWELRGRFNRSNNYKDVLRIVIGGGHFDNTFISGWTQNDNINIQEPIIMPTSTYNSNPDSPIIEFCNNRTRIHMIMSNDIFLQNNNTADSKNFQLKFKVSGSGSSRIEFYFCSDSSVNDSCLSHCQHSIYNISCQ